MPVVPLPGRSPGFAEAKMAGRFLGALIIIASTFASPGFAAAKKEKLPARPIDLNRATLQQLEELPGVGPVMAHSILKFRRQSGPFERVDDLLAIRGISRRRLEKIRPYVFVGKKKGKTEHRGKSRKDTGNPAG